MEPAVICSHVSAFLNAASSFGLTSMPSVSSAAVALHALSKSFLSAGTFFLMRDRRIAFAATIDPAQTLNP